MAFASFLLLAACASAQTTYRDPAGSFTIEVPAGWRADKHADSSAVTISKGKLSVSVDVQPAKDGSTPPPKEVLDGLEKQFLQRCPGGQVTGRGDTNLAGAPGSYFQVACSDPSHGKATMTVAVATINAKLLICNTSSLSDEYSTAKPVLDSILQTFRLESGGAAMPGPGSSIETPGKQGNAGSESNAQKLKALEDACASGVLKPIECLEKRAELTLSGDTPRPPANDAQLQALEMACQAGVLTPEECAAKRAKLTGATSDAARSDEKPAPPPPSNAQNPAPPDASAPPHGNDAPAPPPQPDARNAARQPEPSNPPPGNSGGTIYNDPNDQFIITIPQGWTAKMQRGCYGPSDYCPSGATGVNIWQGKSWVFIALYSARAYEPNDVVMGVAGEYRSEYKNFKLIRNEASTLNGLQDAYGAFTAVERDGTPVALVAVGIAAPNGHYYVVSSSIPQSDLQTIGPAVSAMVNSLRFAGQ